jgi:phosphoglycolate phosphatase-like HAD superfamily hydrolase
MKNITFSADETLIEQARAAARSQGTTLNEAVRGWLRDYSRSAGATTEFQSRTQIGNGQRGSLMQEEEETREPQSVRTERAKRFLALMESLKHVDLGGPYTRDELNER